MATVGRLEAVAYVRVYARVAWRRRIAAFLVVLVALPTGDGGIDVRQIEHTAEVIRRCAGCATYRGPAITGRTRIATVAGASGSILQLASVTRTICGGDGRC